MKLAITICRPCSAECLYNYTGDIQSVSETYIVEVPNLPQRVISAIDEKKAEGCVTNISFVKEEYP